MEGYQTLGAQPYRRTHGGFADWATPLGQRMALSAGVQAGRFEYSGGNAVRDSDFATLAASVRRAFETAFESRVEIAANVGYERNIHDDRQDLSRRLYGGRLGGALSLGGSWTLGSGLIYQRSRYREPDAILLTTRDDRYVAGELSVACKPLREVTLRLEYTEARNRSNIELYEYQRRTVLLRGRYEFR